MPTLLRLFAVVVCLVSVILAIPLSTQAIVIRPVTTPSSQHTTSQSVVRIPLRGTRQSSSIHSSRRSFLQTIRVKLRARSSRSSTPSSQAASQMQAAGLQKEILDLVNAERRAAGVPALAYNALLGRSAQAHADDMRLNNYFSHTSRSGQSPTDRMKAAGYSCTGCSYGENIAKGHATAKQVMENWLSSPGHRRNILSTTFTEIGIGISGQVWVQNFGSQKKQ